MLDKSGDYFSSPFPPVPYHIQRGIGFRHLPLGDSNSCDGGNHGENQRVSIGPSSVFLSGQRTCHIEPTREDVESVLHPHITLQQGRPTDEYIQDAEHVMPDMPHT